MKTIPEGQGFPGGIQKDGKVMGMYEACTVIATGIGKRTEVS